jgi:hypothetical protein
MITRKYRVRHVCEHLWYIDEWRFIRSFRGRKCSAHWARWNSPVLETRSRRMAQRVAMLLNFHMKFPKNYRISWHKSWRVTP